MNGNNSEDIATLVTKAQAGDVDSFTALYKRFHPLILNFLRRIYHEFDYEAMSQEVFLSSYLKLSGLKSPEKYVSWLYRIARNIGLQHLRANGHPTISLDGQLELLVRDTAITTVGPDCIYALKEMREHILRIIQNMPTRQREAIIGKLNGSSIDEEVTRFGISASSVKKLRHFAYATLKKELATVYPNIGDTLKSGRYTNLSF